MCFLQQKTEGRSCELLPSHRLQVMRKTLLLVEFHTVSDVDVF